MCKAPEFPKQIGGTGAWYILPEGVCACMRAIAYPQYRKQLKTHFFVQLLMFSDFDFLVIMFLVIAVIQLCSYFNRSTRNLHFS